MADPADDALSQVGQASGSYSGGSITGPAPAKQFGATDTNGNPLYVYYGGRSRVAAAGFTYGLTGTGSSQLGSHSATPRSGGPRTITTDQLVSIDQAMYQVYAWQGTKKLDEWAQLLIDEGLIQESDRGNLTKLNDFWQQALQESVNFQMAGKKVTPQQALKMVVSAGQSTSASAGQSTSASMPSTRVSVNVSSPTEAKGLITNSFMQMMGRAPTDAEVAALTEALQSAQRANPNVMTSNADGTTTTTTGGLDAGTFMSDQVKKIPGYGEYQAGTFVFNNILDALASPV